MEGLKLEKSGVYIGHKARPAMSSLNVVICVKVMDTYPQIKVINTETFNDVEYSEWYKITVTKQISFE
jgi:hypothetical protein